MSKNVVEPMQIMLTGWLMGCVCTQSWMTAVLPQAIVEPEGYSQFSVALKSGLRFRVTIEEETDGER